MSSVRPDQLAAAVASELAAYSDEAQGVVEHAVLATAKSTVAEIRRGAERLFGGSGDYAKSWAQRKNDDKTRPRSVRRLVYSRAPYYRIAHLLENGHAKANGGRVLGRPHIAPAEEKAADELEELISRGLGGIR